MTSKDALGIINSLANFVSAAYNLHLAVVTAIVGIITAAFNIQDFVLNTEVKVALAVIYGFVALTTIVSLKFLYQKINALYALSNILLAEELKQHPYSKKSDYLLSLVPDITKPVTGYIHKYLFPLIVLLVLAGIVFAPADKESEAGSGEEIKTLEFSISLSFGEGS